MRSLDVIRSTLAGRAGCPAVIALAAACYAFAGTAGARAQDAGGGDKKAKPKAATVAIQPVKAQSGGCGSKPTRPSAIKRVNLGGNALGPRRAKAPGVPEVATEAPWPGWSCDKVALDLKPIWAGQPLAATWTIKNSGEGDLKIYVKGG